MTLYGLVCQRLFLNCMTAADYCRIFPPNEPDKASVVIYWECEGIHSWNVIYHMACLLFCVATMLDPNYRVE